MRCTCGHPGDYNYAIDNGLCNSCIAEKLDQLQSELDKYRWIPVGKRLPKETGEYLVLPRIKYCPSLWYQGGEWFWYDRTSDCISDTTGHNIEEPIPVVTHWQPIIPPEGE